jgi:hypothetical protein
MAKPVGIDRAEPAFQKPPIDDPAEPRQRRPHIDDLIEPRPEKIALSAVPPLLRPHRITLPLANGGRESRAGGADQFARNRVARRIPPVKTNTLRTPQTQRKSGPSAYFTDD